MCSRLWWGGAGRSAQQGKLQTDPDLFLRVVYSERILELLQIYYGTEQMSKSVSGTEGKYECGVEDGLEVEPSVGHMTSTAGTRRNVSTWGCTYVAAWMWRVFIFWLRLLEKSQNKMPQQKRAQPELRSFLWHHSSPAGARAPRKNGWFQHWGRKDKEEPEIPWYVYRK